MKSFKFLNKNHYYNLNVGTSFTLNTEHCTVTNLGSHGFGYHNHNRPRSQCYMTYKFYLNTFPQVVGKLIIGHVKRN